MDNEDVLEVNLSDESANIWTEDAVISTVSVSDKTLFLKWGKKYSDISSQRQSIKMVHIQKVDSRGNASEMHASRWRCPVSNIVYDTDTNYPDLEASVFSSVSSQIL
jgi:hypothetical protein